MEERFVHCFEPHQILLTSLDSANKKSKHSLLLTFLWHYKGLVLSGVPPRLGYIGLEFAQPFLVETVLDFVQKPVGPKTTKIAGSLTAAYALAYMGIAVCFSWYEHQTYRLVTAFRGSLVSMIFDKTLRISSAAVDEAEAVTHMSADIERIGLGIGQIHKIYGSVIELGVAIWLLSRLLGVATAAAAGFVICMCFTEVNPALMLISDLLSQSAFSWACCWPLSPDMHRAPGWRPFQNDSP